MVTFSGGTSGDKTVFFQFAKLLCQKAGRAAGTMPLERVETRGPILEQVEEYNSLPTTVDQIQRRLHRAGRCGIVIPTLRHAVSLYATL